MKIVKTSCTPSGVHVQIEDWSMTYPFMPFSVACYPIAKSDYSYFSRGGNPIRVEIKCNSYEESLLVLASLESGDKHILDYKDKFYEPKITEALKGRN